MIEEAPLMLLGRVTSFNVVSELSRKQTSSFSELPSIPTNNFMEGTSFLLNEFGINSDMAGHP